ncbi:MAG: tyrosine-type recombinase/integrase [Acidimicrobiales bacterium]
MEESEQAEHCAEVHFLTRASEPRNNSVETANAALAGAYLDWCERVRDRSPRTVSSYRYVLGAYTRWLAHRGATTVSRRDMELFVLRPRPRGGDPAAATKRREVGVLRSFYTWLWEEGYTSEHMARGLHGPKPTDRDPKPIPDADWKRLWLADWDAETRTILGLAYFGGLRRRELWELTAGQLGTETITNFRRKGGAEKQLPISALLSIYETSEILAPLLVHRDLLTQALTEIGSTRASSDWLMSIRRTASLPEALNKRFTQWCRRVDISHYTPHQCRHSAATNLARAGLPPHLVMAMMNHSSLDVTMRYIRTSAADLNEWLTTR